MGESPKGRAPAGCPKAPNIHRQVTVQELSRGCDYVFTHIIQNVCMHTYMCKHINRTRAQFMQCYLYVDVLRVVCVFM